MLWAGRMRLRTFRILVMLVHASAACEFGPFPYSVTGIVCRMTKPAALLLNQETARVIQAAFRNAKFPNITGERSMRLLGKVAYGLTNIQVNGLSIEQSEVELKENDAIHIAIKNVTAFFKGTLTYGYAGAWFLQLFHSVDFEIESSIDLQINIKLMCQKDQVAADASDCYLTFHKLTLHLQGDKEPGWLKQLFTDFISFTLKLVLKSEVCNEISFLAQVLANFVHDLAANFVQDEDIRLDISLASVPLIKANYLESHHKGLVLYKNYSDVFSDSVFSPSLLTESRMLYFWLSEHILNSLASAAFLDKRLGLTITGEKLQALFEMEDTEAQRKAVQMVFQGTSYNDSVAKVWSLAHPQISVQPEGTVVKSLVGVEISILPPGEEPLMALYMEKAGNDDSDRVGSMPPLLGQPITGVHGGCDLLLACQTPDCDLQLDHKILLLNECLQSKKMSRKVQNSEIAFFFNLVINANTMEIMVTIQAAYAEKKLILHPVDSRIEFKVFKCTADPSGNDPSIRNFLQTMISVVGIPEVISRIEPALTSLMNSKGLHLFEIRNPEIITRKGYVIVQLDFSFPNHLLLDFLEKRL